MNINVGRAVGIGVGMFLSFCALLFGLFCAGMSLNEPGVTHRHFGVVVGFLPYLFTCWLVYRFACADDLESFEVCYLWDFYPKAFWRAVVAEICVCVIVVAFLFLLVWSATRQSHETPHPRETPPPIMKN